MYRKVKRDGSFFLSPYIQREMPWITEMPTIFLPSRLYVNAIEKKNNINLTNNFSNFPVAGSIFLSYDLVEILIPKNGQFYPSPFTLKQ